MITPNTAPNMTGRVDSVPQLPGPGGDPEVQEAEAGDHPVSREVLKVQEVPLRIVEGDPVNWAERIRL